MTALKAEENKFVVSHEHFDRYRLDTEDFGYKTILISGMISGRLDLIFGRLIQVRKKSGAFGTDTVLLRDSNGELLSFHNMGFFSVKPEFLPMYEEAMKECDAQDLDHLEDEYSIENRNPAVGFVVHGLDDTFGKEYVAAMAITITKESNSLTVETKKG